MTDPTTNTGPQDPDPRHIDALDVPDLIERLHAHRDARARELADLSPEARRDPEVALDRYFPHWRMTRAMHLRGED